MSANAQRRARPVKPTSELSMRMISELSLLTIVSSLLSQSTGTVNL